MARHDTTEVTKYLFFVTADEPTSFEEAEQTKSWRLAMLEELQSIEDNRTWELVDLPIRQRPIGLKWVFNVKRDEHGTIVRHKAWLVAKGYVQSKGVDFDEVFAPVARMETVRMLLAIATFNGWEVHHMNVKTTFLNGELKEEVYVTQLPRFIQKGQEQKVLKLQKALYGLRQAPRAWNLKLDESLIKLGFQRSPSEHAIYGRRNAATRLIVGVYVDDLIITGSKKA